MKKDLIKLANDLDSMGYVNLANKVDSLLKMAGQLYDVPSGWGLKSNFSLVKPESIASHYYDQANRKGTPEDLQSYIADNDVLDWQKEKVTSAIMSDSRWSGSASGVVGSEEGASTDRPVTKGELEKLVMHSMDSGNTYKMSDDMYEKIKDFIFGEGNLPKDSPSNDVMLSDLNDVERAAIMSTKTAGLKRRYF
jgi:hypothetical protein